ncbi:MAG: hypothetical protein OEO20_02125 [Gemmatimonadota bacterium]|nr:hypothetical protein [Gemmatimonadota bacterium]MDH3477083.1 hypothetical protein [Gemmatimonadota bacterium]MDH3571099.1 hypothetical protein [Gemmatimonadota bacterium]MDH5551381.1 hypothetical protein [Gemmatimonadota bacterium]
MIRRLLGSALTIVGWVGWGICGFGGLGICLRVLYIQAGAWGVLGGFLLGPLTFLATPWYALVALGTWVPLVVCYAGGFVSTALIGIGAGVRY